MVTRLPKEFDFKSNINELGLIYHAKETPQEYYKVSWHFNGKDLSWNFTKKEMMNRISHNQYIIIGDEHLMENYICINGKKAELTEEQMKALGIELPKASPFNRVNEDEYAYYIEYNGEVRKVIESPVEDFVCRELFNAANYCTDKAILEQRALYETLSRLLWRYSMEHKAERVDKKVWTIHKHDSGLRTGWVSEKVYSFGECIFDTLEIAESALKEIVEPFMKAHPEFKF